MKWHVLAVAALVLLTSETGLGSQSSLFDVKSGDQGYCGALSNGITMVNGDAVMLYGGRIQWIADHEFGVGYAAYGTYGVNDIIYEGSAHELQMGFTGLDLEYYFLQDRVLHGSFNALIGGGRVIARKQGDDGYLSDDFITFMPQINAELNVTDNFRIAAGVGYRFANGVNLAGLNDADLSGVMANVTFKFGVF